MHNKTIIVTGANAGIGRITALELAKMGARVVMVCRDKERGAAAQQAIIAQTGNRQVDLLLADLSSQQAIRQLVKTIQQKYNRLDVLVNNAGAMFASRRVSVDGLEMTFALNHMNYFLLTALLLDMLKASAPSRIVNVSSDAHQGAQLNFADLQNEKRFMGFRVYGQSKLANIYFTYELARRLEGTGVTVNALHPGFVATNFAKNNGWLYRVGMFLMRPFAMNDQQGAATQIYLASSPEVEGITGKYFARKKAVASSNVSYDIAAAQKLWQASEELSD
ncbi:MAG: SDR family oxidoreductase [Chloroflexi bacterium]|nr:SDR family oxidoreductase [Chloroflexota bacterium]MBP8054991.1 SDR family oxidoreductase [Chloroflexota bacterium]